MRFDLNKKKYTALLAALILLFIACFLSMLAFFAGYCQSAALGTAAAASFAAIIALSIVFSPSMVAYEKRARAEKLAKRDFLRVPTSLTYGGISTVLAEKGFKRSPASPDIFTKTVEDNCGDAPSTRCYNVRISAYGEEMKIESPIKEEAFGAACFYLWLIFLSEINEEILAKFKKYESREIARTEHKAFRRCCYYPAVLICKNTAYYLNFTKSSANIFLNIINK